MSATDEQVLQLVYDRLQAAPRFPTRLWQELSLKRVWDICGAAFLLVLTLPVFLVLAVLIKLSGQPVFFRQIRIGKHGRPFRCLKFRSMVVNADIVLEDYLDAHPVARAEWEDARKLRFDPRVTSIGNFLRRTSLDELPQLWNVIRGDMSLVGPRPVIYDEVPLYGNQARYYLSVRPGITGLWQVSGRNDVEYRRRVAMDVYYVRNRTASLDLWILLRTIGVVISAKGAY